MNKQQLVIAHTTPKVKKRSPVITHDEIALQTAEYESRRGKVRTSPIEVRMPVNHVYKNLKARLEADKNG